MKQFHKSNYSFPSSCLGMLMSSISICLIICSQLIANPNAGSEQDSLNITQLVPGNSYKFVLFDDTEILGTVSAVDSVNIKVKKVDGTSTIIPRSKILSFAASLRYYPLKNELNSEFDAFSMTTYSGYELDKIRLSELKSDTMTAYTDTTFVKVPVDDVRKFTFPKHGFWKGTLYGTLGSGVILLSVIAIASGNNHGGEVWGPGVAIILVPFVSAGIGLITGVITEFLIKDDVYFFKRGSTEAKMKNIIGALRLHKK